MSKKAIYLLGIVLTIFLGTWLYLLFCCNCCSKAKASESLETNTISSEQNQDTSKSNVVRNGFGFTSPELNYKCSDNFLFNVSEAKVITPVSDSIDLGISKLKSVLEKSKLKFAIKGYYASKEINNSIFPDLGLARANAIKNYLVEKGLPENKLELFSQLDDQNLIEENNLVYNAVSFDWLSLDVNPKADKDWSQIRNEIRANPLTLYFQTGESNIALTEAEKDKLGIIVDYLNHVLDSKIDIVGHTDNVVGPRNTNEYYSKKRAEFAQKYFIANGIPSEKIESFGKGAASPIADNETEEGRAKNRRVEVTIK